VCPFFGREKNTAAQSGWCFRWQVFVEATCWGLLMLFPSFSAEK
jgi:hypothetical protein